MVVGYRVTNQVRITLHDTKKLGAILDKVVSLGAEGSTRSSSAWTSWKRSRTRRANWRVNNVTDNAKLYAKAAGVGLGPVLNISEEESSYQPRFAAAPARMEMAKDVSIEAGTATVEIRIRVTWEIN